MSKLATYVYYAVKGSPFIIAFILCMRYVTAIYRREALDGEYDLFVGAVIICATLSALSFAASGSSIDKKDRHRKRSFRLAGERLFHGAIRFVIAMILIYGYFQLRGIANQNQVSEILLIAFFGFISLKFTFDGLSDCSTGLAWLHRTLVINRKEKPDDTILKQ